jgi:C-terminal processing protease CtpA/Prc
LPPDGDSAQALYKALKDPFTTYTPPTKSEERATAINTSLVVGGDVGMRYSTDATLEHPIKISRVYPNGPAGRAGIPRNGNIIKANKIELIGEKPKQPTIPF